MLPGVNRRGAWLLIVAPLLLGVAEGFAQPIGRLSGTTVMARPVVDTFAAMERRDRLNPRPMSDEPIIVPAPLELPGSVPGSEAESSPLGQVPQDEPWPNPFPVGDAPQTLGLGFRGVSFQDQLNALSSGALPPDTMGAIGPDHFVEIINGSVAIFSKVDGSRLSLVTLNSFFSAVIDSISYPRTGSFDPRVIYDRVTGRWFASALERGNPDRTANHALLAVSANSDPSGTWTKYLVEFGDPDDGSTTFFSDYETLGLDDNGVYLAARIFGSTGASYAKVAAIPKAPLLSGSPVGVTYFSDITDMFSTPQPAHNFDSVTENDAAWFVASSPFSAPANAKARIALRRLLWSGGTPSLDLTSSSLTGDTVADPINAPALGSITNVHVADFRLLTAVIRSNRLWTCRNVGVSSSGSSSQADRTGCEWIEIRLATPTAILQQARVYDPAPSDPRFYYYPAIMVSGQGHVVMGFSGSRSTEFIAAYHAGRLAGDPVNTMQAIELLKDGEAAYERLDTANPARNRWGDYSATTLDPDDDMTMWTIQEYAESDGANSWGTWIAGLLAPAPTLDSFVADGTQGDTGVVLDVIGTGLFDPGSAFPNHLVVTLTGGSPNGITNTIVNWTNAAQARVTFDITPDAQPGDRNIVLINPDGQTATVTNGFTVLAAEIDLAVSQSASPSPVYVGGTLTYSIIITNQDTSVAGAVTVTDTLPNNVTFGSAQSSQGTCAESGGIVTCALGYLTNATSALVTIIVSPNTAGPVTNLVAVVASSFDPTPSDGVSELVTVAEPVADLAVQQVGSPSPVNLGADLTITLTVTNPGPSTATGVVLTNTLPPSVTFVSAMLSQGTHSESGGVISCDLGTLETRASALVTLVVVPSTAESITNFVEIAAVEFDSNTANNTSTSITPVNDPPTLSIVTDQVTDEDTLLAAIEFTVNDLETPPDTLSVSVDSSNQDLVPDTNLTLGGSGADRTLTILPATNRFGTTTITLSVSDGFATTLRPFQLLVNPVNDPPVLAPQIDRQIDEGATLAFTVSATDVDQPANTLTFAFGAGAPVGAALDPVTGQFSWTPSESQGPSTNPVAVIVTDNAAQPLTHTNTFSVTVLEVNQAPVLDPVVDRSLDEGGTLAFIVSATDIDQPTNTLTFAFGAGAPGGATLDPVTGQFDWTPSESQGPSTNPVVVIVSDNAPQPLTHTNTFAITVLELNEAPVLDPPVDRSLDEGGTLAFTVSATDIDQPTNTLTFAFGAGAPDGATLDPVTGQFSWTPSESQGPSTNPVVVIVSDNAPQPLTHTNTFAVTVLEVNQAPVLDFISNQTARAGSLLSLRVVASDADLPGNQLTFNLDPGAPGSAVLGPATGEFSWTPKAADAGTSNTITLRVTDNGSPALSATRSFGVVVAPLTPVTLSIADSGPPFRLLVTGDPGLTYALQASENLPDWTALLEVVAPAATFELVDTNSAALSLRLYRLKVQK